MPNLERFNNENAPAANAPAPAPAANTPAPAANTPAANTPANAPAPAPAPAANTPANAPANAPASANAPQEDSEFKKFLEELVEKSRDLNRGDRIRYTYNDTDVNAIGKLFFDKNPGYVINMDDLSDLIRRISRLSLDTHPNKGGSQEKQQIVNDILTVLRALKRNENAANNSNSESNSNSLGEAEEAEEAEQANASANAAEDRALELQEEAEAAAAVAEANPDDAAAQDAASTAASAAAAALTNAEAAAADASEAAVELDDLENTPSQNNTPALRNRVPPLRNIVPPLQPRSVSPSATNASADAPPANVNIEAETKKVIENLVKKSEDETETPFTPDERAEFDTLPNNIKTQYIAERNRLMFGNNIRTASQKKTPRWRGLMNNMKKQTGGMRIQKRSVTPVGKGINMRVKKAPKKMSKKKGKGKKGTRKL
jgi:hypothetical protein